jgi:hypothetical protein
VQPEEEKAMSDVYCFEDGQLVYGRIIATGGRRGDLYTIQWDDGMQTDEWSDTEGSYWWWAE